MSRNKVCRVPHKEKAIRMRADCTYYNKQDIIVIQSVKFQFTNAFHNNVDRNATLSLTYVDQIRLRKYKKMDSVIKHDIISS
jgi:hypothetical protein